MKPTQELILASEFYSRYYSYSISRVGICYKQDGKEIIRMMASTDTNSCLQVGKYESQEEQIKIELFHHFTSRYMAYLGIPAEQAEIFRLHRVASNSPYGVKMLMVETVTSSKDEDIYVWSGYERCFGVTGLVDPKTLCQIPNLAKEFTVSVGIDLIPDRKAYLSNPVDLPHPGDQIQGLGSRLNPYQRQQKIR